MTTSWGVLLGRLLVLASRFAQVIVRHSGELTDENLMRRYSAGDEKAFDDLFARYGGLLLAYFERQLFRPEEAADLLQDLFLQVHRARADYDPTRPLRPWLYTIARNLLREHFRRMGRKRELPATDDLDAHAAEETPETGHEATTVLVRRALAELPDDQRDAITLHWLEELPFTEVAVVVGASVSAVKVRAHRGYKVLARKLARGPVTVSG